MNDDTQNEDIDFEPEDELGDVGALKAKIQKLRNELEAVKKERQEYLDGWQRAKADMVNARKDAAEALRRAQGVGVESFVAELIPALDSFDMAMAGEGWQKVGPAWREGVESILSQIVSALQTHGIEIFGNIGESFDPNTHEVIQEVDEEGEPGKIVRVLRRGYRSGDRILRPAQVAIIAHR